MADISPNTTLLESTWRSLARALAAGGGALTALISLFAGVPLATACARGALALFGVLLVARLGALALERTCRQTTPVGADANPVDDL